MAVVGAKTRAVREQCGQRPLRHAAAPLWAEYKNESTRWTAAVGEHVTF